MDTTDWKTIWILPLVWLGVLLPPYLVAASMGTDTPSWGLLNNCFLLVAAAGMVAQLLMMSLPPSSFRVVLPVTGVAFVFLLLRVIAADHQAVAVALFWNLIFVTGALLVVGLFLWGILRLLMSFVVAVRDFVNSVIAAVVRTTRIAVGVGIVLLCMYGGKAMMDVPREGVRPVAPGGRVAAWALGVPMPETRPVWVNGRITGIPVQGQAGTGYGDAGSTPAIIPEQAAPQTPQPQVSPDASPEELERLARQSMAERAGDFGLYGRAASAYMKRFQQYGNPKDMEGYRRCDDKPQERWWKELEQETGISLSSVVGV